MKQQNVISEFVVQSVLYVVLLLVVPLLMNGATVGMKLLKIRLVDRDTDAFSRRGIVRMFVAIYSVEVILTILAIANRVELNMDSSFYELQIFVTLSTFMLTIGIMLVLVIHVLIVLFSKGKRAFFFDMVGNVEATRK